MTLTDRQLYAMLDDLVRAAAGLPHVDLPPAERNRLAGRLFREATGVVRATTHALVEDASLFSDFHVDPAELSARQDRAQAFLRIAGTLQVLQRRAMDCYLIDAAWAVGEARGIVAQVYSTEERPGAPARERRRRRAMAVPARILAERQRRKRGAQRRAQADEG